MFHWQHLIVVALASTLLVLAQPEFVMNCTKWPDICDNTCNALYCHNVTDLLRYDPTSTSARPNPPFAKTSADYRRDNVGCGANNYCPSGTDCDEYPYASTFDGGVGCINGGFNVSQSGTTRCASPSQNRSHGATLAAFFRNQNLTSGAQFRVVVRNDADLERSTSAVCKSVHPQRNGTRVCPTDRAVYRFTNMPLAAFCPSRPRPFAPFELAEDHKQVEGGSSTAEQVTDGAQEMGRTAEEAEQESEERLEASTIAGGKVGAISLDLDQGQSM